MSDLDYPVGFACGLVAGILISAGMFWQVIVLVVPLGAAHGVLSAWRQHRKTKLLNDLADLNKGRAYE